MGSALSAQSKDERHRRSNRLSKPQAKRLSTQLADPVPPPAQEAVTGSPTAVSPRVRASQSHQEAELARYAPSRALASQLERDQRRRIQSFPNLTQLPSSRPGSMGRHLSEPILEEGLEASYFPAPAPDRQIRRRSFQLSASDSHSPLYPRGREPPRRAHSAHCAPQPPAALFRDSALDDEIIPGNTRFLIDNQRFSLTRRRSLVTRPGVATRGSRPNSLRIPSPIRQEREGPDDGSAQSADPSPRPPASDAGQQAAELCRGRPITPGNLEYAQLGALRLGSLRVVNGTASPSPSDMSENNTTYFAAKHGHARDLSTSPFSIETSSGSATTPDTKRMSVCEDEGIALQDGESSASSEGVSRVSTNSSAAPHATTTVEDRMIQRQPSQLTKADSGYSSATSDRSSRGSRPRKSMDSQVSTRYNQDTANARRADSGRPRAKTHGGLHHHPSQHSRSAPPEPRAGPRADPTGLARTSVPQRRGSPAQYDLARRTQPVEMRSVRSSSHLRPGDFGRSNSLPHRFAQPSGRDLSYAQQVRRMDAARVYPDRQYCASQPDLTASGHHRASRNGGLHRSATDTSLPELSGLKHSRHQLLLSAETGIPPMDMHLRRPEWSRSGSGSGGCGATTMATATATPMARRKSLSELVMMDRGLVGMKPKRAPRYRSAVPGEDIPPIPALPTPGSPLLRMQSYGELGFPVGNNYQQGWNHSSARKLHVSPSPVQQAAQLQQQQQYRNKAPSACLQKAPPAARGVAQRQLAVR